MVITADHRTPFVYWAQDEEKITLKVDIQNAENIHLEIADEGNLLKFSATASVDEKAVKYSFSMPLFDRIEKQATVENYANRVEITLQKLNRNFWKFGLLRPDEMQKQAYKWLKFDFEKWRDDPDDLEEEKKSAAPDGYKNPNLERMLREFEKENNISLMSDEEFARKMNIIYGTYLLSYNLFMFCIHFILLCLLLVHFVSNPKVKFLDDSWPTYFQYFVACTCLQYLDVLNSVVRLTKGSYKTSLLQVTGRLAMLLIINGCSACTQWTPVFTLMVTYLLSEQFRYPYYALNSLGISVHSITWLRYNAWLFLYPIGLFLEGIILFGSIPYYYQSGVYSLQMPNALNMSFNFGIFLALFSTTCFPYIAFTLLKHMQRQRREKMAKALKKKE